MSNSDSDEFFDAKDNWMSPTSSSLKRNTPAHMLVLLINFNYGF